MTLILASSYSLSGSFSRGCAILLQLPALCRRTLLLGIRGCESILSCEETVCKALLCNYQDMRRQMSVQSFDLRAIRVSASDQDGKPIAHRWCSWSPEKNGLERLLIPTLKCDAYCTLGLRVSMPLNNAESLDRLGLKPRHSISVKSKMLSCALPMEPNIWNEERSLAAVGTEH